jgi:hypothetical protein
MAKLIEKIAKVGLAPSAFIGTQILKGVSLITKKDYGTTKEVLASAVETKTGKVIGGATAAVGAALVGVAATTTAAGVAITKAVGTAAAKVGKTYSKLPAPAKVGIAQTGLTAGAVALFAPETAKAVAQSPEALKTIGAAAIGGPVAGVVVGLEQGTSLLSESLKENAPKVAEVIKENIPAIVGAGTLGAAALGATTLLKDKEKEITAALPKEAETKSEQIAPKTEVLPQTQTITATTGTATKKRKKTRSKALPQQIRQAVNIDIINNNSSNRITKKYINAIALRN